MPTDNWTSVGKDLILKLLPYCDGFNLLDPVILKLNGIPEGIVDRLTELHRAGHDGKHSIHDLENNPLSESYAVYSMDLLLDIARDMGLAGSHARAVEGLKCQDEQHAILIRSIHRHLDRLAD